MSRVATRVDSGHAKSGRVKNCRNSTKTEKTRVKLELIMTRSTRHISGQSQSKSSQL